MNNYAELLLNLLYFSKTPDKSELQNIPLETWQAIYELARKQRIDTYLAQSLKDKNLFQILPPEMQAQFQNGQRTNTVRNLQLYRSFHQIAERFQTANIPIIALKGTYLAEHVYQNISLRAMNDIDLLVRESDLKAASEIALDMGYKPLRPFSTDWETSHKHLPRMNKKGAATLEIHWNLTPRDKDYSVKPAEFWKRAVKITIANQNVLTLSPEDTLLFICEHNSYGHQFNFGLRPYLDITMLINFFGEKLDWESVIERAHTWHWTKGIYLSLYLADALLGAPVPDTVLQALRPANLTNAIIDAAKEQLFDEKYLVFGIAAPVTQAANQKLGDSLKTIWSRIFIPRIELANRTNDRVSPYSWKIYFYYIPRIKDLFLRHTKTIINLRKKETPLALAAKRKSELVNWLEKS